MHRSVFVAFDTETTGLYPGFDQIVEIAACRFKNGEMIDEFQTLVNPERDIPSEVTDIHGITEESVTVTVISPVSSNPLVVESQAGPNAPIHRGQYVNIYWSGERPPANHYFSLKLASSPGRNVGSARSASAMTFPCTSVAISDIDTFITFMVLRFRVMNYCLILKAFLLSCWIILSVKSTELGA